MIINMFSGFDEWGQVEDFIMCRQTDSLPGQEASMTRLAPRKKNTFLCILDLSLKPQARACEHKFLSF